tara:strand:- start:19 stop:717 length:699 start_codon:yes stop_codon:yes gene_type:complete
MRVIKTKAPIDVELLQQYFMEEEEIQFEIMYYDSDIKGRTFFNYVSNLDIDFKLNLYNTTQEEKYELLRLYFTSNNLITCKELELGLTYIVLKYNNIDVDDLYSMSLLTEEWTDKFIDEFYNELLNTTDFLESLPITTLSFVSSLSDFVNEELKNYEVVDDPEILGKNVINLINNPFIFEIYETSGSRKRYFKHYSEEYIYDEQNLYGWMLEHNVPLLVFVSGIAAGVQPNK